MQWHDYKDVLKREFWPDRAGWIHIFLISVLFGFIISFGQWGGTAYNASEGIANLVIASIFAFAAVGVHHAAQRLVGLWNGYRISHKTWWLGPGLGIAIALFTNGGAKVIAGSSTMIEEIPAYRLHHVKKATTIADMGWIAASGPLANFILAAVLYAVAGENRAAQALAGINLAFGAYNLLPIPPLDGIKLFFAARGWYVVVFSAVVSYALLSLAGITALWPPIVIGILAYIIFWYFLEKE